MSLVLLPPYNAYKDRQPDEASRDLIYPLLVHVGIWSSSRCRRRAGVRRSGLTRGGDLAGDRAGRACRRRLGGRGL